MKYPSSAVCNQCACGVPALVHLLGLILYCFDAMMQAYVLSCCAALVGGRVRTPSPSLQQMRAPRGQIRRHLLRPSARRSRTGQPPSPLIQR